ncbi:MAG TPA: extracellular solute-binding protein [Candidatus Limnocylindrales bacterium]|nr:extracellular solute-binding protein [Candidatus Limnocylindrales bacterium]
MPGTGKTFLRVAVLFAIVAIVASACSGTATPAPSGGPPGSPSSSGSPASSIAPSAGSDDLAVLVAAAEKEGSLTTIALSHDWCNYGEAIKTFTTRYAIAINELNPDAGFGDQVSAIKANKDKGPQAPDVIDVGLSFGAKAKADGLLAPYKVGTWDSIPDAAKDPDGFWYGDYYGVLAFETNKTKGATPPTDWADLLDPSHANQVALAGDPRVSSQAIQTVYAAALANGGSLDNAKPGLDFFAKLKKAGNLVTTIASPDTIDQGTTPVTIRWTYSALAHRDSANGSPDIDVTVPTSGRLAGMYVQAISAYAPHPNAARLWMEFLYSDEGQNIWLKGYCNPIRFEDLASGNAIPADVLANLPDTAGAVFPTLDQLTTATTLITQKWNSVVGVDIK